MSSASSTEELSPPILIVRGRDGTVIHSITSKEATVEIKNLRDMRNTLTTQLETTATQHPLICWYCDRKAVLHYQYFSPFDESRVPVSVVNGCEQHRELIARYLWAHPHRATDQTNATLEAKNNEGLKRCGSQLPFQCEMCSYYEPQGALLEFELAYNQARCVAKSTRYTVICLSTLFTLPKYFKDWDPDAPNSIPEREILYG